MLISELPQPYKALAEKHRKDDGITKNVDNIADRLSFAFPWGNTKEGYMFWSLCFQSKTESELPPYPYE